MASVLCSRKMSILFACTAMSAHSLFSADFHWVGASNDWRNSASYSSVAGGEGGTQMPGADDRIVLSANQRVYVDDSTISFFSTVKEVQFAGTNIVADFCISGDADL